MSNQAGTVQTLNVTELTVGTIYNNDLGANKIGTPQIKAVGVQTLSTNAAPATLSFTPPRKAGVYRLSGQVNLLTASAMTWVVKITYHDPGGNAITDTPGFYLQNGTAITAGGNTTNTAGRYIMIPYTFEIDNSSTAITIQDNSGTYTTGTYYWTPILEQLA